MAIDEREEGFMIADGEQSISLAESEYNISMEFIRIRILIGKLRVYYDCLDYDCDSLQNIITNYQDALERNEVFALTQWEEEELYQRRPLLNGCVSYFQRLRARFGTNPIRTEQALQEKLNTISAILDELIAIKSQFVNYIFPNLNEIEQWISNVQDMIASNGLLPATIPGIQHRNRIIVLTLNQTINDLRNI